MSCGVGRRHGLDPVLLWLWCKPADTAPIRPVAWEPPYALGVALKKKEKKAKKIGRFKLLVPNHESLKQQSCNWHPFSNFNISKSR